MFRLQAQFPFARSFSFITNKTRRESAARRESTETPGMIKDFAFGCEVAPRREINVDLDDFARRWH